MTNPPAGWLLWVTRRALEDLGMEGEAGPAFDLDAVKGRNKLLGRFADQRAANPRGTELTQHVTGEIYNLHAQGGLRGATWFDEGHYVVFLLAASSEHDYDRFVDRSAAGLLLPSRRDYQDVTQHRHALAQGTGDFVEDVADQAAELVKRALAEPGQVVTDILGQELPTHVVVEVVAVDVENVEGDVYAALSYEQRAGVRPLPDDLTSDLAAVLFPDAVPGSLEIGHHRFPMPRGRRPGDVVIRWFRG